MTRGHRPRSRCTHVRQITVVQQNGLQHPGTDRKQHHQARRAWQALFRVVEKSRGHFDCKAVESRDIGGFHIHFTVEFPDGHGKNGGHDHLAP